MSMLAICIVLAITGQNVSAPVIQEAELAPPAGMSEGPFAGQTTPRASSSDLEIVESPTPSTTTTVQELQWEYDEEGKPVARPAPAPEAVKTPDPAPAPPAPSQQTEQQQTRPKSSGSQHVATFWFVLPK